MDVANDATMLSTVLSVSTVSGESGHTHGSIGNFVSAPGYGQHVHTVSVSQSLDSIHLASKTTVNVGTNAGWKVPLDRLHAAQVAEVDFMPAAWVAG